jgi:hypothetical protein
LTGARSSDTRKRASKRGWYTASNLNLSMRFASARRRNIFLSGLPTAQQ